MTKSVHLLSKNNMQVDQLCDSVCDWLEKLVTKTKPVALCRLITEELVANAISHGGASEVRVSLERRNRLRVEIRDDGKAFNPFALKALELSNDVVERSIGGLGLHLVRSGSAAADYKRSGQFNITTVEIDLD